MPVIKLSKILKEVVEKTTINNQHTVLTSSKTGLVDQSLYFNKQVASKDNIGYKIIKRGQYTYRSMSDTGYFYINRLKDLDVGIVSPAYPVFELFTDLVIPEYLDLYFNSDLFQHQINSFSQGSTRLALKFNKLITLEIYAPSLEIQKKIVEEIDLIRNLKQNFEQNMNSFDDLVKSQFIEMFGDINRGEFKYEKIMLKDVCEKKSSNLQINKLEDNDGIYPLYGASGLVKNIDFYCSDSDYLGVVKDGSGVGKIFFLEKHSSLVGTMEYIYPNDKITIRFLEHTMKNLDLADSVSGVAIPHIYFKNYSKKYISLPPKDMQFNFGNLINQIDKSKYFGGVNYGIC